MDKNKANSWDSNSRNKVKLSGTVKILYTLGIIMFVIFAYMLVTSIIYLRTYMASYAMSFGDMWKDMVQYAISSSVQYFAYGALFMASGKIIVLLQERRCIDVNGAVTEDTDSFKGKETEQELLIRDGGRSMAEAAERAYEQRAKTKTVEVQSIGMDSSLMESDEPESMETTMDDGSAMVDDGSAIGEESTHNDSQKDNNENRLEDSSSACEKEEAVSEISETAEETPSSAS